MYLKLRFFPENEEKFTRIRNNEFRDINWVRYSRGNGIIVHFILKNRGRIFRQKQLSFANYLTMLGVVFAIDFGMEAFLLFHVYPPDKQQFLNGVAPNTLALLTGNGSYEPMTDSVRVADFVDLVMFLRIIV